MYDPPKIAERIKITARSKHIRVGDLFATVGLSKNTLHNMNNNSMLSTDSLAYIADYLDCSVDYLLGRTEFVNLKPEGISQEEMRLIALYRQLNQEAQETLMIQADALVTSGKYKKYGSDSVGTKEA